MDPYCRFSELNLEKLEGCKVKVVKLGLNESHRKNNSKRRVTFMILISLNYLRVLQGNAQ